MIIEFSVENFRSIKDEVTFSFISSSDKLLESNLIKLSEMETPSGKPILNSNDDILKSSILYGANASGKSNVLMSLAVLKNFISSSGVLIPGQKIPYYTPFKLDAKYGSKPTKFHISFIKNKVQYTYELVYNADKITKESLYYYPNNKRALIFDIDDKYQEGYKFTIDIARQKDIYKRKIENIPYLNSSALQNYDKTREAFSWFTENLEIIGPTEQFGVDYTKNMIFESEENKSNVLRALLCADIDIYDIVASTENISYETFLKKFPMLKDLLSIRLGTESEKVITTTEIYTVHKGYDKENQEVDVLFDLREESEGTRKMYNIIGPIIDILYKGKVLVIDELEPKMHNKLCRYLIQLFHNPTQNKNNAQLLFTSHNTNLLDLNLFRRDQIWFTMKNRKDHSTELYSLLEFKQRNTTDIESAYNIGRYGALPRINEFAGIIHDKNQSEKEKRKPL